MHLCASVGLRSALLLNHCPWHGLHPVGLGLPREQHPYYIATQAHPELRSRPTEANPLFRGLIAAALERHRASELFEDDVEND